MRILYTTLSVLMGVLAVANAAVIYDETVDGDANGAILSGTDLGTLTDVSEILGSIDAGASGTGNGSDEQDSYLFTTLGDFSVDFSVTGDLSNVSLRRLDGPTSADLVFLSNGFPGDDIFESLGELVAGVYSLTIIGPGNAGSGTYALTITPGDPIPLPGAAVLMASAAIFLRKRTAKRKR
ncbi:MAG: hypothetical protein AAF608_08135 [Pseudomonadota bacterium]